MLRVSVLGCSLLAIGLAGCAATPVKTIAGTALTGNWRFASTAPEAAGLPALSGSLRGGGETITGTVHAAGTGSCLAPATTVELHGSADSLGLVTLRGALAGGTLTITGAPAADGRSLLGASYTVLGGACGFTQAAQAQAQMFTPIEGNYAGSFADSTGPVIRLTAALSQTPAADTSGNYQLSGTANFTDQSCFSSPLTVSNTQVSGGSFTLTYADAKLGNSVTASGTFSSDGTTLDVSSWTSTGSCGSDAGTGLLTKQ